MWTRTPTERPARPLLPRLGLILALAVAPLAAADAAAEVVVRRGIGASPGTLDPAKSQTLIEANVLYDLFEGLVTLDALAQVRPALADRWEITPDGLTYTFHLRDNARWSDGSAVTAQDFVFSLRRLSDPRTASPYAFLVWPIVNGYAVVEGKAAPETLGVEAPDPHTVVIRLAEPTAHFLAQLAHQAMVAVQPANLEKHGDDFTSPGAMVSNGAFVLAENVPQDHLTLVRNPHYYEADQVKVDKVIAFPLENQEAELKQFRAGELDVTYTLPTSQIKWAKANLPDAYQVGPMYTTNYLAFNLTNEPWKSSPKLREALSLAIDRRTITEKVIGGDDAPEPTFTPPGGVAGYHPPVPAWFTMPDAERIAAARAALAASGYGPGGKPLPPVEVLYSTGENARKVLIAISAMWKQVLGIESRLDNQEFRVVVQAGNDKTYKDVTYQAWIGDYADPYTFLQLLMSNVGPQNIPGYASDRFNRLITEASASTDPLRRLALMAEAEAGMLADHPLAVTFHEARRRLVSPRLKGFLSNPLDIHPSRYLSFTP